MFVLDHLMIFIHPSNMQIFYSKMQKKRVLCIRIGKISTTCMKIAQTAPARFSKYAFEWVGVLGQC